VYSIYQAITQYIPISKGSNKYADPLQYSYESVYIVSDSLFTHLTAVFLLQILLVFHWWKWQWNRRIIITASLDCAFDSPNSCWFLRWNCITLSYVFEYISLTRTIDWLDRQDFVRLTVCDHRSTLIRHFIAKQTSDGDTWRIVNNSCWNDCVDYIDLWTHNTCNNHTIISR